MKRVAKPKDDRWVGKRVTFDGAAGTPMVGKTLSGFCEASKYIGKTDRGKIDNWTLTVRGASGKTLEVNMVEQYARFEDIENEIAKS